MYSGFWLSLTAYSFITLWDALIIKVLTIIFASLCLYPLQYDFEIPLLRWRVYLLFPEIWAGLVTFLANMRLKW